jgi:hypothetical protein
MIYVASPYSADKKLEVNTRKALEAKRFQDVLKFVYALTKQGYVAFSPIVYYHPLALFVLHLPNWDQSKGVQLEMKVAKTLNIPTLHFDKDGAEIKVN